jgi:hypothetical protein
MKHRILLTVEAGDSASIEDVFVKISDLISGNGMKVVDILPRCPYDHYPYGQSCCKQECEDGEKSQS